MKVKKNAFALLQNTYTYAHTHTNKKKFSSHKHTHFKIPIYFILHVKLTPANDTKTSNQQFTWPAFVLRSEQRNNSALAGFQKVLGGKLQEMGVVLYTFYTKASGPPPPQKISLSR